MKRMRLNELTKKNISSCIGKPFGEVIAIEPDDEKNLIRGKVIFSKRRDIRKLGRGNPLLARKRIRTLEEVELKIKGMQY